MGTLKRYKEKRDFTKTKEPRGVKKKSTIKKPIFVIQQHAARAMHYDFRIEIGGVLVSWAVPKGPSLNPRIKRLAIMTEDHPIEYARFEGIIPEGEYGAGPVIIWDKGIYKNIRKHNGKEVSMKKCLNEGQIEIFLEGEKLEGGYALVRTNGQTKEKSRWLLIKMRDGFADARRNPTSRQPESVKSGQTIKNLKAKIKQKTEK